MKISVLSGIVLGVILSVALLEHSKNKLLRIQKTFSPIKWIFPIILCELVFPAFIIATAGVSLLVSTLEESNNIVIIIIHGLLSNGLFVLVAGKVLTRIFAYYQKEEKLDLLKECHSNTVRNSLSVIIFVWVVKVILVSTSVKNVNREWDMLLKAFINSAFIWMLLVVGTFLPFGEDNSDENQKLIGRIKRLKEKAFGEKLRNWIVERWVIVLILFITSVIIMVTPIIKAINEIDTKEFIYSTVAFSISMAAVFYIYIKRISEDSRKRMCERLFSQHTYTRKTTKPIKFGRMRFWLEDNCLHIEEVKMKHEKSSVDMSKVDIFNAVDYEIEDAETLYRLLAERNSKQNEYYREACEKCDIEYMTK